MYPLKMKPLYKEILWGGNTLRTLYGRRLPFEKAAESWEVAAHKNGCSEVENGSLKGKTIPELMEADKQGFLGSLCKDETVFPLLFKLIDARDYLSVQVHPDDFLAKKDGDKGKTELWIVLSAEEGAGLYIGFNKDLTAAEYEEHIKNDTLKEVLNFVSAKPGDVFFIKAGTVHAIGKGLVIAEIQQNSDTTYRVYDWGRLTADGTPRELHIEKALKASNTKRFDGSQPEISVSDRSNTLLYYPACRYFGAVKAEVNGTYENNTGSRSFHILFCSGGEGELIVNGKKEKICAGDTFLLAANSKQYSLHGKLQVFFFFVPDFEEDYKKPLLSKGISAEEINKLYIQ